ncbi:MAG TPA: LptF/LptG family permease [Candidatus Kapabacteria bacterium]|nr:LptF/LptG family permease [Candidatus Kapabacteria bacterium]
MMKILDFYVLRNIFFTFIFSIIALCSIFLIVNLMENLDKFIDLNTPFDIVVEYYAQTLPDVIKLLTPVAMLIAMLFTIGGLSNKNEITAMKTGTMSLYRLMFPLVVFGLLVSFIQLYFNGWVVPKSNERKFSIEQKYLNKEIGANLFNLYFRDNPLKNIVMRYYDPINKTGHSISIEEFSSEKQPRLTSRIDAQMMIWDSTLSKWKLIDAIYRNYSGNTINQLRQDTSYVELLTTHNQIAKIKKVPEEMTFEEFREYIGLMQRGGRDTRKQMIEYYSNYAFPFANFIVVLFAVPFASVRRKGGIAIQISAALIVSFVYLVSTKFSQTIGLTTDINPIIIGWSANFLFLIIGLIVIFKTKT